MNPSFASAVAPALTVLGLFLAGGCQSTDVAPKPAPIDENGVRQASVPPQMVVTGVSGIPAETLDRVAQYGNVRSARMLGFVGNEMLISTRFGQTSQVHRVATPLATRSQLTFFAEPVASVAIPPVAQPKGFVYGRDVGGSEFYQLFWFDFANGSSRLLSDGKSRYSGVVFDKAGQRFAYSTTERDGVHHDIHINDLQGNRQVVYESEEGWWSAVGFAPDGERLLLIKYISINESELHEVDLASGAKTRLLQNAGKISVSSALYTPDGKSLLVVADIGSEFTGLHLLDRASGEHTPVPRTSDWNVEAMAISDSGVRLAYVQNVDGLSRLYLRDMRTGAVREATDLPTGLIQDLRFHADGERLGMTINSATAPAEAYVFNSGSNQLVRWTRSEVGGLQVDQFVAPQLIRYPTFDQVDGAARQIPAFYYRPRQASDGAPLPVVIYLHGGPEAQLRPYFSSTFQLLATELGVAVIAPNVRGSSGYGKSFLKLDNGYLREDSVKDIGALLDWVAARPELDASRVTVFGGSYGGYMVLAALTRYPERIAAGIEAVGISNFVTFLENTKAYRQDVRRAEYGDERDPQMRAFLEQISPLNQIEKIRAPLMISQGANDPRVPASESDQIYQALAAQDIPVWYLLAKDEGHGFRKKVNRTFNTAAIVTFLERFVLTPKTTP
ncbi:MAG: S9 family peptidase [Pseudomonadales bacterium]